MQLEVVQDGAPDPVSIALMHLDGLAAEWRDTIFLPTHPSQIVPWQTFEAELKARFIEQQPCIDALLKLKADAKASVRNTRSRRA